MFNRLMATLCLVLLPLSAAAGADPTEPDALAGRLWSFSEVVLAKHVDPPSRQEMLLGAAKALFQSTGRTAPPELSKQVSTLVTQAQLADFLHRSWPEKQSVTKELEPALVAGLLSRVAGPPRWITAAEVKVHSQISNNRYVGTGIAISMNPILKLTQVTGVFPRSPAHRAGLKSGDLFVEIDGVSTKDCNLQKVVEMLRGEEGTSVTVLVCQPNQETRTITMVRAVVPFETVVGFQRIDEDTWKFRIDPETPIGYVWLKNATTSTLHELRQIERQMRADGVKALALDLRYSNADQFEHTLRLADALLDGGTIARTRDAQGKVKEYAADRECLFRDWPVAVLINGAGANRGSDFLAMALQNNKRALIFGEPMRGNGFIDGEVELPQGQGVLRMPLSALIIPERRPREVHGRFDSIPILVEPNGEVELTRAQDHLLRQWLFSKDSVEQSMMSKPPDDPVLRKAVEVLRVTLKRTEGAPPARSDMR